MFLTKLSNFLLCLFLGTLTLTCQTCTCYEVIISPHDIAMEMEIDGLFNICLNEEPDEEVKLTLAVDHSNVVTIDPTDIIFNESVWEANVTVTGTNPGKVVVNAFPKNATNFILDEAYIRVNVKVHDYLDVLSNALGWLYFICWTSNFYPQIFLNFRRKSVTGLSLDYILLNLLGTFCYSIYNLGVYCIREVQNEYYIIHPYGIMPVKPQDVAFAIDSFCMTGLVGLQGIYYNRKTITVSKFSVGIVVLGVGFLVISLIIASVNVITWLDCLYYFSYVKLGITTIKYIPQVYSNYRNKSTAGFSVGFPILDFTGGAFSIMQMFLDAYNYDDWSSLFGNPTKFLLGIVSMAFDSCFLVQHFILYRKPNSATKAIESGTTQNNSICQENDLEKC